MLATSNPSRTPIRLSALTPYRVFIFGVLILLAVIVAYKLMGSSGVLQKMLNPEHPADATAQTPANPEQVKSFKDALEESIKITQKTAQSELPNQQSIQNPFAGVPTKGQKQPTTSPAYPFAPAHNPDGKGVNR